MTTQLDLTDFLRFPWLCDNAEMDTDQTPDAYDGQTEEDIEEGDRFPDVDYREPGTAFLCKAKGYRILVCECMGWKCGQCHPHHSEMFTEGKP